MQTKQISTESQLRTHVLVFKAGDKAVAMLKEYVTQEGIKAARFTAIGAFELCMLAFFDCETKDYSNIPVKEQTEVLVMAGNVAWHGGEPVVHAHVVLGKLDGSAIGGHLKEARVRPTLELVMEEQGVLQRRYDEASGLPLIDLDSIG